MCIISQHDPKKNREELSIKQINKDADKKLFKPNMWFEGSRNTVPDQNDPQTPGTNNLFFETAMWHVDVPQTNTIRWHIASSSGTEKNVRKM
jgi:hypothetical protein